jgi:hypothetical protein
MVKKRLSPAAAAARCRCPRRAPFFVALLLAFACVAVWVRRTRAHAAPAPAPAAPPAALAAPQLRGAGLPSLFNGNVFEPGKIRKSLEKNDPALASAGIKEACKKKGMTRWILCQNLGFKYIPGDAA